LKITFKIIIVLLLFNSCQSGHDGYKDIGNDVHFKLLSFENSSRSYNEGDYISATIRIVDNQEIKYRWFKYLPFSAGANSFGEIFNELNVGDSATLLINKSVFNKNPFGFNDELIQSEYVKMNIKVHKYFTEKEYQEVLINNDEELLEQQLLKQYLKEEGGCTNANGVYVQLKSKGQGEVIEKGIALQLKYTGNFITGVPFDTTFQNKTFEYVYGTPNQVIEGFDKALKTMKTGEKAKIIIPSQFAFGEDGSSTGIVPPYSTVVYNLEIINIK